MKLNMRIVSSVSICHIIDMLAKRKAGESPPRLEWLIRDGAGTLNNQGSMQRLLSPCRRQSPQGQSVSIDQTRHRKTI